MDTEPLFRGSELPASQYSLMTERHRIGLHLEKSTSGQIDVLQRRVVLEPRNPRRPSAGGSLWSTRQIVDTRGL
jgi:hypothetical protein